MASTHEFNSPLFMEPEELESLGIVVDGLGTEAHNANAAVNEPQGAQHNNALTSDDASDDALNSSDVDTSDQNDDEHDYELNFEPDDSPLDDDIEDTLEDSFEDALDDDELDGPDDEDEDDDSDDDTITFADLGLPTRVLDALDKLGFVTPTPIQEASIPALLDGKDVVGIAQTGTGKTAAFGLPMLAGISASEKHVQGLVLAPTRELAMQSAVAMENFADLSRGIDVVPVYGGSAYGPQIAALKKGAQIVVGTPGRVIDLIEKGALDLSHVRYFVLDEADEMLRMGFAEDVETITETVPEDRLTALFSATMPPAIEKIAATHLSDPVKIEVTAASSTVDTITQTYAVVPYKHKIGALGRVLAVRHADAAIVFVRTRMDVEEISLEMAARGFRAAGISGDVAQAERERLVERLRKGTLDVLVATDVAARGLDVERIGLVVNFDVPREPEAYVHRIGRTGRAGREGLALTFFTPKESYRLRRIEKLTGTKMEEAQIPSPAAVSDFRARRLLEGLGARIERGRLDLYKNLLAEVIAAAQADTEQTRAAREEAELAILTAKENDDKDALLDAESTLRHLPAVKELTVMDFAAALMAQAVGDEGPAPRVDKDRRGGGKTRREETLDENGEFASAVFEGGRDKTDKSRGERGDHGRAERGSRGRRPSFGRRYRVEVGKKDGVGPGSIVGAITGEGGIQGRDLGRIEIFPTFSLVEINADLDEHTMARIGKAHVQGRALRIREDQGAPSGDRERGNRPDSFDRGERSARGGFRADRRDEAQHGDRGFERDRGSDRGRGFDRERGSAGDRGFDRGRDFDRDRGPKRGGERGFERDRDFGERRFGGSRGSGQRVGKHAGSQHGGFKHGSAHGAKHGAKSFDRGGRDAGGRDFGGREFGGRGQGGRDFGGRNFGGRKRRY